MKPLGRKSSISPGLGGALVTRLVWAAFPWRRQKISETLKN
jgi:hypothetical protein